MAQLKRLNSSTAHLIAGGEPEDWSKGSRPSIGIVHFGLGNFHRSHQAMYVDRLITARLGDSWAICGVGLLERDREMFRVLAEQDCLFTLTTRHPDGTETSEVIRSIQDFLMAPDDNQAVIELLASPLTKIVSLTVTEGAYLDDSLSDEELLENLALKREIDSLLERPETVWGYIVEGLRVRKDKGIQPFTVLSCDNMQHNGQIARRSALRVASLINTELADWIEREVAFPSTMVDRITPTTVDTDRERITRNFGVVDEWPVTCEPFTQWILEDNFPAGRPALEEVGAFFTDDIEPFETTKLRLLNGPHQALAYIGQLAGYTYVDEAMQDVRIRKFVELYMSDEVQFSFTAPTGLDVVEYSASVIERFSNPTMKDPLIRLSVDSTDRMPIFVVPVAHDLASAGASTRLTAAVIATWCAYWGSDMIGERSLDRNAKEIVSAAQAGMTRPRAFLEAIPCLATLIVYEQFVVDFSSAINSIRMGCDVFLEEYSS